MTDPLPPTLDAALAEALRRGDPGPFPVMVLLRADPGPGGLKALGLEGEGSRGQGLLDRAAVLALGARADVMTILLLPALPSRPGEVVKANPKIEAGLANEMVTRPGEALPVLVTFRAPPAPQTLAGLGLSALGDGAIAMGTLDPAAIRALAARDDVLTVAYQTPPEPAI